MEVNLQTALNRIDYSNTFFMSQRAEEHVMDINCSECQNKIENNKCCSPHVLSLQFSLTIYGYMYCGLVDAKLRASDKELPVTNTCKKV